LTVKVAVYVPDVLYTTAADFDVLLDGIPPGKVQFQDVAAPPVELSVNETA
jgi:hypothetical protein